MRLKMLRIWNN